MKPTSILVLAALSLASPSFAAGFGVDKGGAAPSDSSDFTVSQQTQIPGTTLKPGSYSIHVVDKLADRTILEVDSASGKAMATFLGLSGSGLPKSSGGKIAYDSGTDGKNALRGFAFPKGPVLEFVYPKAEAVSLAKANGNKIPAIDPASEGRVEDPTLSKSDMQVVTLWMLSTTKVGTDGTGPGIKAEKYQQQVASNHPPRPAIKELPHTASELPLIVLLGAGSLLGAGLLSVRRRTVV